MMCIFGFFPLNELDVDIKGIVYYKGILQNIVTYTLYIEL